MKEIILILFPIHSRKYNEKSIDTSINKCIIFCSLIFDMFVKIECLEIPNSELRFRTYDVW